MKVVSVFSAYYTEGFSFVGFERVCDSGLGDEVSNVLLATKR